MALYRNGEDILIPDHMSVIDTMKMKPPARMTMRAVVNANSFSGVEFGDVIQRMFSKVFQINHGCASLKWLMINHYTIVEKPGLAGIIWLNPDCFDTYNLTINTIQNGNSLAEQLAIDEKRQKLEKQIAALEKQARAESQPKKKFELVEKIRSLEASRSEVNGVLVNRASE